MSITSCLVPTACCVPTLLPFTLHWFGSVQLRYQTHPTHLLAVTIDGDGLVCQRLGHKVADDAPVIQRHAWSIRVEDTHNAHLQNRLAVTGWVTTPHPQARSTSPEVMKAVLPKLLCQTLKLSATACLLLVYVTATQLLSDKRQCSRRLHPTHL